MIAPASAVLGAQPGGGGTSAPVVVTLAEFTSSQNNLDSLGADTLRVSSDARRDLTGILAAVDGKKLRLHNVGGEAIVLRNQNAMSDVANRIETGLEDASGFGVGNNVVVPPNGFVDLEYDLTITKWVMAGISRKDDGDFTWSFSGVLNTVQNNLIPVLTKAQPVEVFGIRLDVQGAPTGQAINVRISGGPMNEVVVITIGSGNSGFASVGPHRIPRSTPVSMAIEQVGSGAPGTTLTAVAYTRPI